MKILCLLLSYFVAVGSFAASLSSVQYAPTGRLVSPTNLNLRAASVTAGAITGATITATSESLGTLNLNTLALTNRVGSNVVAMSLTELSNVITSPLTVGDIIAWNGTTWTNVIQQNHFTPVALAGSGGALTNYTVQANQPSAYIAVTTNVSIRGIMSYTAGIEDYWSLVLTNMSGANRTFEISGVTNQPNYASTYGTNAPTVITNMTRLRISACSTGTNVEIGYVFTKCP